MASVTLSLPAITSSSLSRQSLGSLSKPKPELRPRPGPGPTPFPSHTLYKTPLRPLTHSPRNLRVTSQLRQPIISPDDQWGLWTALFATGAFGLWSEKTKIGGMVSAALVSTLVGLAASNVGIIPHEAGAYSIVLEFLLPLAIPLLLFRADLRSVASSTGTLLLVFLLGSARWHYIRSKYQVSYLARSSSNDYLHSSRFMLHYILGLHKSNFTDAQMGEDWNLKCGWRSGIAGWISHVGDKHPSYKGQDLRALFLHSSPLHCLQCLLCVPSRVLSCEAVELSFSKIPGLSYSPTSMMFLNVPAISKLQWHPFTITSISNMDPDNLSVVIKSEGSWTQNLYQKFASSSTCPIDHLEVSVEGPYGPASNNLLRHDTIVMVSGGSGITPMISIIRELLSQAIDSGKKTPHVLLITAFKKSLDLTMLDLILPPSGTNLDISCLQLQIEAYVTRENQPATHNQKPLQTIWFKPDPLDSPVSAVLGRNSWLSLATTATAVFLWNKKQNSETGQIQGIDTPPRITTSPSARFYNADRELESLPHQYFIQSTKVHHGTRPDLQKILSDCEGSSIGVLVSGPRKMRQEVAVDITKQHQALPKKNLAYANQNGKSSCFHKQCRAAGNSDIWTSFTVKRKNKTGRTPIYLGKEI
ncbi:hypothetical protein ACLB2K_075198 [Fragaria x ananassa]